MFHNLKNVITRGLDLLALVCAAAAALGMVSIVVVIVASVVMRKFANSPLHITEEMVGLLLSVSLFLGLPMVTRKSKHVRVTLVVDLFKGRLHNIIQFLALVIGVVFFVWLIIEAVPWFEFAFDRNLKTETTRILLYPWMALMPLSLGLTCAIFIGRLLGIYDQTDDKTVDEVSF